jgi:hypothetical protein
MPGEHHALACKFLSISTGDYPHMLVHVAARV